MSWNFGDIFEALAEAVPGDTPALIHRERTVSWADLDRRSNNLARWLAAQGAEPGDKVAFYVRNRPEYLELLLACFKARLVHVNLNFRYEEAELHYVLENSDARFVLFGGEFGDKVTKLRDRLPKVAAYLQVDDGSPGVPFAEPYEPVAERGDGARLELDRSGDDLFLLYTGGTTGMPKGVMWRAEDLWGALGSGSSIVDETPAPETIDEHAARIRESGPGMRLLPACPLMHGTGLFTAMGALVGGGSVVTLDSAHLDPDELWRAVEQHSVTSMSIVGDAFGKPMLRSLDASPGRYDLSSLLLIISSGVMWTPEVKKGLLRHHPAMVLVDSFGSSEAVGFGLSITTAQGETRTAKFEIGENVKVFTEEGREVVPGSGEPGYVARTGPIPLGYYKDPDKTAETFKTIDGVRYSIPGDWCTVEEDGTLTLLGRGSVCINSGGEKIYPEEVEEVLKAHVDVDDALVVGVPDEKWGQAVTAVVQLRDAAQFDEAALRRHVHGALAGFKTPKRVLQIDRLYRAPNGKADYQATAAFAREQLGIPG
jgi:fatty-acyl-CoA synthase